MSEEVTFLAKKTKRKNKVSSRNGESSTVPVAGFQESKGEEWPSVRGERWAEANHRGLLN